MVYPMMELLFLLCFVVHNLEEAVWLPPWSRHASRFHQPVQRDEFLFGLLGVTLLGCALTFLRLGPGRDLEVIRYLHAGFVLMMMLNAVFPHLAATVALRRYAPGLITGLGLIVPVGGWMLFYSSGSEWVWYKLAAACVLITAVVLVSLPGLFRLGRRLLPDGESSCS